MSRIDWDQARKSGEMAYTSLRCRTGCPPYGTILLMMHNRLMRRSATWHGLMTAQKILPQVQGKRKSSLRDDTLSCLCAQSKAARRAWREAAAQQKVHCMMRMEGCGEQ